MTAQKMLVKTNKTFKFARIEISNGRSPANERNMISMKTVIKLIFKRVNEKRTIKSKFLAWTDDAYLG